MNMAPWEQEFNRQVDAVLETVWAYYWDERNGGAHCYLAVQGEPGRLAIVAEDGPTPVASAPLPHNLERAQLRQWIVERARTLPILAGI